MTKKGDTLIEVTLAVGIFSMIAIGIAAVMSSGTAGAQTALETTLTREEIDTQAESLRFIQAAYSANKDSADERYSKLWSAIKDNAIDLDPDGSSGQSQEAILQYTPKTCRDSDSDSDFYGMYNSPEAREHAFVINPRALGTFTANDVSSVYMAKKTDNNKITAASIYPRLVFNSASNGDQDTPDDQAKLVDDTSTDALHSAEGLYVIAVKDSGTTKIVDLDNKEISPTSAFYDFYIRACWYGTNSEEPSTISTVIRLYDPDATK